MRLRSLGALPRLCLPVGQLTRACQLTARAPVPPPRRTRRLAYALSLLARPRSYLSAGLCLLVRRPASGSIAPLHPLSARAFAPAGPSSGSRPHSHPLVSKNANSLRYNSGAVVLPKRARRLPGMMQTANMEKQACTIPCRIITQTFGLFRANPGLYSPAAARKRPCSGVRRDTLPVHWRGNNRVPVPRNLCLAVASVPINETDALQLGVGLDLLVNPADAGSPGAFRSACPRLRARRLALTGLLVALAPVDPAHPLTRACASAPAGPRPLACPCPRARRPAPTGLPVPLCPPVRARWLARAFAPAGSRLLAYLRPHARWLAPPRPPVPTFSISRKFAPRARVRPYSSGLRRGNKGICASETP